MQSDLHFEIEFKTATFVDATTDLGPTLGKRKDASS
jgi:hypothetical protein